MRAVFPWAAILLPLIPVLIAGCKPQAQAAAPTMPPPPVTAAVAVAQDVPVYIDEIGKTVASEVVNIVPQVSGEIMSRTFTDGQMLKKGDPLFVIDRRPYQAKLKEAEANVAQAKAQIELAQADYNRLKGARTVGAASQEDLDTKQAALDTAVAQVGVTEAALDTAKLNLSYCDIASPIDGRAGQRTVDTGNVVLADQTTLLNIQKTAPLYVDFTVTERDFPRVRELSDVGQLHALVSLPQTPDVTRSGPLTFIDTAVQPSAGRVRVQVTLENTDKYLWPGQFVNVRLVLKTIPKAVLIPYSATQMGQQGLYVYVIDNNSVAHQTPIEIGQRQGPLVVISKGVNAGDRVVLTGQLSVTPGAAVRIVEPEPVPPGSAAPESPAAVPSATPSAPAAASAPAASAPAGGPQ